MWLDDPSVSLVFLIDKCHGNVTQSWDFHSKHYSGWNYDSSQTSNAVGPTEITSSIGCQPHVVYKIILGITHTLVEVTVTFVYQCALEENITSILKLWFHRWYYLGKGSVIKQKVSWLKKNINKIIVQVAYGNDKNSDGHM